MTGASPRKSVSPVLEIMSPRELRHYLAYLSDTTFERFLYEARACQVVAEMQMQAICSTEGLEHELREWAHTLDLIDASILFAETSHVAIAISYGATPFIYE